MAAPDYNDEQDELTFWERYRVLIGMGVLVLIGAALALSAFFLAGKPSKPKPPEEIAIHLLPPPTPPPPPPPPPKLPPPPPEQKMVEQPPVKPNEVKPKEDKAPEKPPGPPGPAANGPPSDFGLGGGGGGGGSGLGGGGGSRFGFYANEVTSKIKAAINGNEKMRSASAHVKVRIWVDAAGRITRVHLTDSTDDPSVDAALQNDVLNGLTLPEPPPSDMPMPIVMVVSEMRPN